MIEIYYHKNFFASLTSILTHRDIRILHQIKNSLAGHGEDVRFEIRSGLGFRWLSVPRYHGRVFAKQFDHELPKNKHELASILILRALSKGDVESSEMHRLFAQYNIGRRTIQETKTELGIQSYRKMWKWYWHLEGCEAAEKETSEYAE